MLMYSAQQDQTTRYWAQAGARSRVALRSFVALRFAPFVLRPSFVALRFAFGARHVQGLKSELSRRM